MVGKKEKHQESAFSQPAEGSGGNGNIVLKVERMSTESFLKFLKHCGFGDSMISSVAEKEREKFSHSP